MLQPVGIMVGDGDIEMARRNDWGGVRVMGCAGLIILWFGWCLRWMAALDPPSWGEEFGVPISFLAWNAAQWTEE